LFPIFLKHIIVFFFLFFIRYVLYFHDCSSDRLLDEQINIAVDTRDHLVSQRLTFKRLQTRINDISNRFPVVNSLLQRINFRKRRDSIILGLVIGVCTILLLMYAFH
jgi:Golgi SNAP receptor complex protein 1